MFCEITKKNHLSSRIINTNSVDYFFFCNFAVNKP